MELTVLKFDSKEDKYHSIIPQIEALIDKETNLVANLANISAALNQVFNFLWIGFYIVKNDELILGPFQGTVACTRIAFGKGVCGKAWELMQPIIVGNVTEFPGHIACSPLSKSEIVIPIFDSQRNVFMVLDIDSDKLNAFEELDKVQLVRLCEVITKKLLA